MRSWLLSRSVLRSPTPSGILSLPSSSLIPSSVKSMTPSTVSTVIFTRLHAFTRTRWRSYREEKTSSYRGEGPSRKLCPFFVRTCPRRLEGVVEQHRPRHGTDTPWYRRDVRRYRLHLVEPHVSDEATPVARVDADVDDHRPFSYVFCPYHLSASCGDDQDLGPTGNLGQVLRVGDPDR